MLNRLGIKTKLLAAFIIVSLLPLGVVAFLAVNRAGRALQDEAAAKFTAIQEAKRNHLEDYFTRLQTSVKTIQADPYVRQCITSFGTAFEGSDNTVDSPNWQIIVDFREPRLKEMVADYGFGDLLLISTKGYIIYTTARESDIGMQIPESELAATSLGRAFQMMAQTDDQAVVFADFAPYPPLKQQPAAFMASRVMDEYAGHVGYVAIRLSTEAVNAIVQQRSGLGETGESYLVGATNGQTALRSDRVVKAGNIGGALTDTYSALAVKGQSGIALQIDTNGNEELVRYDPLTIEGLTWGMVTTAATSEVFAAVKALRNTILVVILVVVAAVIALALGVTTIILKPINGTVLMLKDIAEGDGDLTKRLTVDTRDEIGEMATWFNTFMDKLQKMIRQISDDTTTLNEASTSLSAIAGQMNAGVENMSQRSLQVASASEQMSANMNSVAAASEQAATNVNMVAAATEEMTATVNEIAQNSEKAHAITESAVSKAGATSAKVDELGRAANEISKVTEVINDISEQINLLALNATIEAARAGEAGKGFAVVANEIKELAKQTAAATHDIKTRIQAIQHSTGDTVTQIEEISAVINQVNDIVGTIATAV
ncbi:MAG: methyl-accepting chemotaxis protein, partial [Desulfatitalea sp.]|nr:methyl-accepting chemotaxis protein [Desulfatitalea sp.]